MLVLESKEVCPYSAGCPYSTDAMGNPCYGTLSSRNNKFVCNYVENGQIIKDASPRIPGDKTGSMKVIME